MSIDNDWHLFVLHYLFIPRIQQDLDRFKNIWNNHSVSTERNLTPLQMLVTRYDNFPPPEDIDEDEYGIGDDDVDNGEDHQVPCDPMICPMTPHNLNIFKCQILPLSLATPESDLENWFYTAIECILKIKIQQEAYFNFFIIFVGDNFSLSTRFVIQDRSDGNG